MDKMSHDPADHSMYMTSLLCMSMRSHQSAMYHSS